MSDDQGRTGAPESDPEPEPDETSETDAEGPTRDPDAPGVGALGEGDDTGDADPPEPNEPA